MKTNTICLLGQGLCSYYRIIHAITAHPLLFNSLDMLSTATPGSQPRPDNLPLYSGLGSSGGWSKSSANVCFNLLSAAAGPIPPPLAIMASLSLLNASGACSGRPLAGRRRAPPRPFRAWGFQPLVQETAVGEGGEGQLSQQGVGNAAQSAGGGQGSSAQPVLSNGACVLYGRAGQPSPSCLMATCTMPRDESHGIRPPNSNRNTYAAVVSPPPSGAGSALTCKHFRPDAGQGVHEAVAGAGVRVQIDGVASGGHLIGKRLSRFGVGEALHLVQATELHKRVRWAIVRVCGFSKLCKCERQVMVRRREANSKTNIMAGAPPPS